MVHAALAILIIGLLWLVKAAVQWLGEPELFGIVPLGWVFDAMDAAILLVFMFFGVKEAIEVFRE